MNKVEKIRREIEKRYEYWKEKESNSHSIESESRMSECQYLLLLFNNLQEEPVSNDLEEFAKRESELFGEREYEIDFIDRNALAKGYYWGVKAGAQWQKKHLEMNRIKHCDNITEEQYNLETEFLDGWIEKYDRIPTFLDAIEHGMKLQKEQDQSTIELAEDHAYLAGQEKIIEKACVWLNNFYSEDRHCYLVEEDIDNFKKAMEE